ncbi:MAG: GFA family protein [Acidiferrobacterales bacterium]
MPVRVCECSFCKKHNATYTSHGEAGLTVAIAEPSRVSKYLFGTNTAEFHVCGRCGVMPFATSRIDGELYAVVNVNTFEDADTFTFTREVRDYEAESLEDRLARRKRVWIPAVSVK